MIKVILLISAMGMNQQLTFPNMETCLEVRATILEQDKEVSAICLPAGAEDLTMNRMDRFFEKFMEMVESLENTRFRQEYYILPENQENYQ